MRQWESWRAAVPELISYDKTLQNENYRQGAVSSGNLGIRTFDAIRSALA
jgi:hypothetical protein